MDKLSMAIIAMEAHIACTNDRLRQAWDIIHAELAEKPGSPHNSAMDTLVELGQKFIDGTPNLSRQEQLAVGFFIAFVRLKHQ
jgi:hypothetical protein